MRNTFCAISVAAMLPVFAVADAPKAAHPDLSGVWSYAIDLPPGAIKKQVNGSVSVQKVNRGAMVARGCSLRDGVFPWPAQLRVQVIRNRFKAKRIICQKS